MMGLNWLNLTFVFLKAMKFNLQALWVKLLKKVFKLMPARVTRTIVLSSLAAKLAQTDQLQPELKDRLCKEMNLSGRAQAVDLPVLLKEVIWCRKGRDISGLVCPTFLSTKQSSEDYTVTARKIVAKMPCALLGKNRRLDLVRDVRELLIRRDQILG